MEYILNVFITYGVNTMLSTRMAKLKGTIRDLFVAIVDADFDTVSTLLFMSNPLNQEKIIDINFNNHEMPDGPTPLILAIKFNKDGSHENIIQHLLKQNADVNRHEEPNIYGQTYYLAPPKARGLAPLHYAAVKGDIKTIQLLIANGANVNLTSKKLAFTPLHCVLFANEKSACLNYLLQQNANVNLTTSINQETPLHIAVRRDDFESVKTLLDYKAEVNRLNKNNQSPLYLAVAQNNVEIFNYLLQQGAELNKENSPQLLRKAVANNNPAIVKRLLQYIYDNNLFVMADYANAIQLAKDNANDPIKIRSREQIRGLLKLVDYIKTREQKREFLHSFKIFGHEFFAKPFVLFGHTFNMSKQVKLPAAKAKLNNELKGEISSLVEEQQKALNQGNLRSICRLL